MIKYRVLKKTKFLDVKVSYDIEVGLVDAHLPNTEELLKVARNLRSQKHSNTFVCFYLPGMIIDAGAFATGHSRPKTEIRVMDFHLPEQYQHLLVEKLA